MSNLYKSGKINKTYFVQSTKQFSRLEELISLMPSFAMSKKPSEDFVDYYYETEDNFLKEMGIIVRLRTYKTKQIISVKYTEEAMKKQDDPYKDPVSEQEIGAKDDFFAQENLMFIEDKINVIYGGRLQIDILRKLRHMRVVYTIKTKRQVLEVSHNSGFRTSVFFDDVVYTNLLNKADYKDLIVDITMISPGTSFNQDMMDRFINNLREKVVLVPMLDSKYETAILMTRFLK